MEQNNFNHLSRYEDIFVKLRYVLNQYLKLSRNTTIYNFNLKQKNLNNSGFKNDLIENDFTPNELIDEIKSSYLSRDYVEGEIGLIDSQDQYDGIFNIALHILMSNRLAKIYQSKFTGNSNLDSSTVATYKEKYKKLMSEKKLSTIKLIYSLFIYKETETDNDFYYGHRIDNYGDSSFVIDLPVYGQISVHFGSKENLENIEYLARQNINLILEKKLELGQITEQQFAKIKEKADKEGIFPKYTGKLYEYSSAIPLDYCGEKFEIAQKDLKLNGKMITEISDDDIKKISENKKYNSRELYYFAIKNDFSKSQLEKLSSYLQERDKEIIQNSKNNCIDVKSLGKKAVSLTTAEERKNVDIHEEMCNSATQNNSKEK